MVVVVQVVVVVESKVTTMPNIKLPIVFIDIVSIQGRIGPPLNLVNIINLSVPPITVPIRKYKYTTISLTITMNTTNKCTFTLYSVALTVDDVSVLVSDKRWHRRV